MQEGESVEEYDYRFSKIVDKEKFNLTPYSTIYFSISNKLNEEFQKIILSVFIKGLTAEIRNALLNNPYYDYHDLKTKALSVEYLIKMQPCFVTLSAIHYNNKHTLSKLEELKVSNEQQEKIITQKDVNSLSLSLESIVTCLIKTSNRQTPIIDSTSLLRTNNKTHMYKYIGKLKSIYTNTIRLIIHRIPDFQENIDNPKQSTLINICISLIL